MASEQMLSNPQNKSESFSFTVGPHDFYLPFGKFIVGATQKIKDNDYSVAFAVRNSNLFRPLTPKTVLLNNKENMGNPLNGSAIKKLAFIASKILVVKEDDPDSIYVIDDMLSNKYISVFSAHNIKDSNGQITPEILSITSNVAYAFDAESDPSPLLTFAAIKQRDMADGDGLAVALLCLKSAGEIERERQQKIETEKKAKEEAAAKRSAGKHKSVPIDQNKNEKKETPQEVPEEPKDIKPEYFWKIFDTYTGAEDGNRARALTRDSEAIKVGEAVTHISDIVDLFYDREMQRLYIALQVKSGNGQFDGARAVVCAGILNGQLVFVPIVADSAIFGNKIVATRGAASQALIYKVRTMHTRTYLRYLVVAGGHEKTQAKRNVYALPIIQNFSEYHGTLASARVAPVDVIFPGPLKRFQSRVFLTPARTPQDLYDPNSIEAHVGGGPVPGDITDMFTSNDAVFVSVATDGDIYNGTIFYSQALFDQYGRIVGWTYWKPAANVGKSIGFSYDSILGTIISLQPGQDLTCQNIIRTRWGSGESSLEKLATTEFNQKNGGVSGVFDFPFYNPGLTREIGQRTSILALAGLNKLTLIETGFDHENIFRPVTHYDAQQFSSIDGTLTGFAGSASVISVTGGALNDLGIITAVDIINDGNFGWFVAGGAGGLAVLNYSDGTGWQLPAGLSKNFTSLSKDMLFKKISPLKNIRKMVSIANNLYILTPTELLKMEIDSKSIVNNKFRIERLAHTQKGELSQNEYFSDMIISPPLAILATSKGLYRSGNGINILSCKTSSEIKWTQVELAESVGAVNGQGPVTRLLALTRSGLESDLVNGGNLYALNAYVGYTQAQLYRLSVQLIDGKISDKSVVLLPDYFIKGLNTFFVNFGDYRNYIATDGAQIFASRSSFSNKSPLLEILPFQLKSGQRFGARNSITIDLKAENTHSIGRMIRLSASGSWVIHGDFGLRVLE